MAVSLTSRALAGGDFLTIDTRAGTAGDRWRATISEVNLPGGSAMWALAATRSFGGREGGRVLSGRTYRFSSPSKPPCRTRFPPRAWRCVWNGLVNVSGPRPISASMLLEFPAPRGGHRADAVLGRIWGYHRLC